MRKKTSRTRGPSGKPGSRSTPARRLPPPGKESARAPKDGLREQHKRDKRERLRSAAWDLFSTVGYEETTTRAIAESAGVAAGTVFLYAKDKRDLLFLVFEERLASCVDQAFASLPEGVPLTTAILHVFGELFAMYDENPDLARRFVKELPGAEGPNADRVNALTLAFFGRLGDLVERAKAEGEVRPDVLPLVAAQTLFAIYFMALSSFLAGWNTRQGALDYTLTSSLDLLMRGLAPGEAGAKKGRRKT